MPVCRSPEAAAGPAGPAAARRTYIGVLCILPGCQVLFPGATLRARPPAFMAPPNRPARPKDQVKALKAPAGLALARRGGPVEKSCASTRVQARRASRQRRSAHQGGSGPVSPAAGPGSSPPARRSNSYRPAWFSARGGRAPRRSPSLEQSPQSARGAVSLLGRCGSRRIRRAAQSRYRRRLDVRGVRLALTRYEVVRRCRRASRCQAQGQGHFRRPRRCWRLVAPPGPAVTLIRACPDDDPNQCCPGLQAGWPGAKGQPGFWRERFWKLANRGTKPNWTRPVGPLRCLATEISARPAVSALEGL